MNDETRNEEYSEDDDLPALKPIYDRRAHADHSIFWLGLFQKTI